MRFEELIEDFPEEERRALLWLWSTRVGKVAIVGWFVFASGLICWALLK